MLIALSESIVSILKTPNTLSKYMNIKGLLVKSDDTGQFIIRFRMRKQQNDLRGNTLRIDVSGIVEDKKIQEITATFN